MAMARGKKYVAKLDGVSHIIEVSNSGRYITVTGQFFDAPTILRVSDVSMIDDGSMMGVRTIGRGAIHRTATSSEEFFESNAFTFNVSGLREVEKGGQTQHSDTSEE